jgi:transposase
MHVADHHGIEELDGLVRAEPDGKVRDRLRVVAMASAGQTTPQIVAALKLPRRSVQRWVEQYNEHDVAGLHQHQGAGAKPRLKNDQHERLRARLDAGPTPQDGTCAWSGAAIVELLRMEFGVVLKRDAVYKLLHRMNYSWLCPRPRHPTFDAAAQDTFKKTSTRR